MTSNGTGGGNWSSSFTWNYGVVPSSCTSVTIKAGDTVTVDTMTATASTTTVNGTLQFSTVATSSITVVKGSMTVAAGGTLTMGTAASPIPAGTTAYLVLAYGNSAGQYGLTINDGGNFIVYGSTKTPATFYTGAGNITSATSNITVADATGWQNGDTITIDSETVTIQSAPSGNSFNISAPTLTHYSTNTIRVNVLTRNAVVRSSGTITSTNTAYIYSLTTYATSFALTYGEFAYLGNASCGTPDCGLSLDNGAAGSISSSTVRNGVFLLINGSNHITVASNNIYANGGFAVLNLYASSNNTLISNNVYGNTQGGIVLQNASANNTLISNNVYSNGAEGINLESSSTSNNLLISNNTYSNTNEGIQFLTSANNNTLISHSSYANGVVGIYSSASTGNTCVSCNLGYSSASVASPNSQGEVRFDGAATSNLTLKNSKINPAQGIQTSGLSLSGSYLLNYSTNTGVLQVYGDYQVSGSTLTLDYASQLYASTTTPPKLMQGTGHSATVNSTNDTNAASQLITISYKSADTLWHVTASSSPSGDLCTFAAGGGGPTNCPSSNTQFSLTVTPGGTRNDGDRLDFALLAASQGSAAQKRLLFAQTGTALNNGRSKITIASGAGFEAVGISTAPTLLDWLNSSATFYTFVDNSSMTLKYVTVNHADEKGIQITGTNGITLASSTFDLAGTGASSTSTYITANSLNSNTTFYGMVFKNTWSSGTFANYNVWASTEANLLALESAVSGMPATAFQYGVSSQPRGKSACASD